MRLIVSQYLHDISLVLAITQRNLNKGTETYLLTGASERRMKLNTELLYPGANEQVPRGQGKAVSRDAICSLGGLFPGDRRQIPP